MMRRYLRGFTSFINLIYRLAFIVTFIFGAITYVLPHAKKWLTNEVKVKQKVTGKNRQARQDKDKSATQRRR